MEMPQLWVKLNQAYPPQCKCKWSKLPYFFCPACNNPTIILILNTIFMWSCCQWIIKIKLFQKAQFPCCYLYQQQQTTTCWTFCHWPWGGLTYLLLPCFKPEFTPLLLYFNSESLSDIQWGLLFTQEST